MNTFERSNRTMRRWEPHPCHRPVELLPVEVQLPAAEVGVPGNGAIRLVSGSDETLSLVPPSAAIPFKLKQSPTNKCHILSGGDA